MRLLRKLGMLALILLVLLLVCTVGVYYVGPAAYILAGVLGWFTPDILYGME